MATVVLENLQLSYKIRYSERRKSVQIKITADGEVEVAVPARVRPAEIEELLRKRSGWIITQLERLKGLAASPLNQSLQNGSQVLYLGRALTLCVIFSAAKRAKVSVSRDELIVCLPEAAKAEWEPAAQKALKKWYVRTAAVWLAERTNYWAGEIGVRPRRLSVREQKTRWGSASPRGNVNYNWRILMAPPEVVDYLVVHELCHIKVPDHSRNFWLLVAQSIPDYKAQRLWLRNNGLLLTRFLSCEHKE